MLVVASAPSYAHGVVDPVPEIAAAAAARGIRCHVDACIGGWVLPYAARLGARRCRRGRSRSTASRRSRSTPHKYAYAPKGTSILLHRDARHCAAAVLRLAPTGRATRCSTRRSQSTKSGGPLAGAWAVVQSLGDAGYATLARDVFAAVDAIVAGVEAIPRCALVVAPDSTLVALATDDSCDPFTICDEMAARGVVRPAADVLRRPAAQHPPLGQRGAPWPTSRSSLAALTESVAAAVAAGPVAVDPGVVAFIEALDPAALSDDDFDGLLAASGLVGGVGDRRPRRCPTRMAEVNAMLDVASPAMREALLVAFLDRLARPNR